MLTNDEQLKFAGLKPFRRLDLASGWSDVPITTYGQWAQSARLKIRLLYLAKNCLTLHLESYRLSICIIIYI